MGLKLMIRRAILSWEVRCFLNSLFFMKRFKFALDVCSSCPFHILWGLCSSLCSYLSAGTNASCPVNLNSIGYNFVKQPAEMEALYHRWALQQYILLCAQVRTWPLIKCCGNLMLDQLILYVHLPGYCLRICSWKVWKIGCLLRIYFPAFQCYN